MHHACELLMAVFCRASSEDSSGVMLPGAAKVSGESFGGRTFESPHSGVCGGLIRQHRASIHSRHQTEALKPTSNKNAETRQP